MSAHEPTIEPSTSRDTHVPTLASDSGDSLGQRLVSRATKLRRRLKGRKFRNALPITEMPNLHKTGTEYGGWFVPHSVLNPDSVCVCAGDGEDISFDVELIERFRCRVFVMDPTPRAAKHVRNLIDATGRGQKVEINNRIGEHYELHADRLPLLHFEQAGLWDINETVRFYSPRDPSHVSHSALNLQRTDDHFDAECMTLASALNRFGVDVPTVLKIDIEGAEYRVLASLKRDNIAPKVVCVEFDEGYHPLDDDFTTRIAGAIDGLQSQGYALVHVDGWNFTFVLNP